MAMGDVDGGVDGAGVLRMTDRHCGEVVIASWGDVGRIVGVEVDYIVWAIESDGAFENGRWRVERVG